MDKKIYLRKEFVLYLTVPPAWPVACGATQPNYKNTKEKKMYENVLKLKKDVHFWRGGGPEILFQDWANFLPPL